VAAADPLPVADVTQSAETDDGWHLSVALTRMTTIPYRIWPRQPSPGRVSSPARPRRLSTATAPSRWFRSRRRLPSSRFVVRIRQHRKLAPDLGGLAAATELRLGQW